MMWKSTPKNTSWRQKVWKVRHDIQNDEKIRHDLKLTVSTYTSKTIDQWCQIQLWCCVPELSTIMCFFTFFSYLSLDLWPLTRDIYATRLKMTLVCCTNCSCSRCCCCTIISTFLIIDLHMGENRCFKERGWIDKNTSERCNLRVNMERIVHWRYRIFINS